MTEIEEVHVEDWKAVLEIVGEDCSTTEARDHLFRVVSAMLRTAIFDSSDGKLIESLIPNPDDRENLMKRCESNTRIAKLLGFLRSANLQSLGIHFVDPFVGRKSTIWSQPGRIEGLSENDVAEAELYSEVWNRLYRRLFPPTATLINAIESKVLPWEWSTFRLATKGTMFKEHENLLADKFFEETQRLGQDLSKIISKKRWDADADAGCSLQIEKCYQLAWNDLEAKGFQKRLHRVAQRFLDTILDDKDKREGLKNYLAACAQGSERVPPVLNKANLETSTDAWPELLDVIQALQSSLLSQPAFCDECGLWVHRFKHVSRSFNETNIYFIFGLSIGNEPPSELLDCARNSFENLGKSIDCKLYCPRAAAQEEGNPSEISDLVKNITTFLKRKNRYHNEEGLKRTPLPTSRQLA